MTVTVDVCGEQATFVAKTDGVIDWKSRYLAATDLVLPVANRASSWLGIANSERRNQVREADQFDVTTFGGPAPFAYAAEVG